MDTLQNLFNKSLANFKSNIGVEFHEKYEEVKSFTYQEIQDHSNKIQLCIEKILLDQNNAGFNCQKEAIVQPQKTVGIYMPANVYTPSIIIGILNSGCKFTSLNPKAPHSLNNDLLSSIGIGILITYKRFLDSKQLEIFTNLNLKTIECRDFRLISKEETIIICYTQDTIPKQFYHPKNKQFAYSISTSGTTGKPKIVHVPHQCIVANILHLKFVFKVNSNDKVAMMSPLTFDPSIVEIFLALSSAACLVIVSDDIKLDPDNLANVLFSVSKVTVLQCTPTIMNQFSKTDLHLKIFSENSSLRVFVLGGEACPSYKLIYFWLSKIMSSEKIKIDVYNIYGITEVSSWAMLHKLSIKNIKQNATTPIPLGFPLYLTTLEIRDILTKDPLCIIESCLTIFQLINVSDTEQNFNTVKVTFLSKSVCFSNSYYSYQGYLYIGGENRVCCILDSTAEKNICNSSLLRDSGDIVNFTINMNNFTTSLTVGKPFFVKENMIVIDYVGRSDKQIKRHGKRINLLYLKQHLENVPCVSSAFVLFFNYEKATTEKVLVAFVCVNVTTQKDIKSYVLLSCYHKLGHQYVPDYVVLVDRLPITSHGKVDENILKEYFYKQQSVMSTGSTDVQTIFIDCLLECLPALKFDVILNKTEVSQILKHTFIQNGGDSFTLIKFSVLLKQKFTNLSDISSQLLHSTLSQVLSYIKNPNKKNQDFKPNISSEKHLLPKRKNFEVLQLTKTNNTLKRKKTNHNQFYTIKRAGQYSLNYNHESIFVLKKRCKHKDDIANGLKLGLNVLWKYDTHKCVDSSPLVVCFHQDQKNPFVIIGSHSHLFACVSILTGTEKWKTKLGDRIESSPCLTSCGQYLCVGCYDTYVYSIDIKTGEILWKFKSGGEVKSSPVEGNQDSVIFIGSHDEHLYCLDLHNKEMIWKLDCQGGSIFSSPAIEILDELEIVYACTLSGKVLSVSSDLGQIRWTVNIGKPIFSSPLVTQIGICVGCVDNNMYMLSKLDGNTIWKFETEQPIFCSPSVLYQDKDLNNFMIFGSHDGNMYCVNAANGNLIWKNEKLSNKMPIYASPFSFQIKTTNKNEVILMDLVAVASTNGNLSILNLRNGKILATRTLPGQVFSSPVVMTTQTKGKNDLNILVGCRDNFLYLFNFENLT